MLSSVTPPLATAQQRLAHVRQHQQLMAERSCSAAPVVLAAYLSSGCPRCHSVIQPGDTIASWGDGLGWCHAACLICHACGEWLRSDGRCTSSAAPAGLQTGGEE
jgi:hypothetical protein